MLAPQIDISSCQPVLLVTIRDLDDRGSRYSRMPSSCHHNLAGTQAFVIAPKQPQQDIPFLEAQPLYWDSSRMFRCCPVFQVLQLLEGIPSTISQGKIDPGTAYLALAWTELLF